MLVVYDLEYTAWDGSREAGWSRPGEHREIVQIGAVRLDPAAGFAPADTLDVVVRPRRNPVLSDYLTRLTGLTQRRIDAEGIDVEAALAALAAFGGDAALFVSNGRDAEVVAENCRLAGIGDPLAGRTADLAAELMRAAGSAVHIASCDLPRVFGLGLDLPAHDGLADARAVAAALVHLDKAGTVDLRRIGRC
jgi:inhibitor of KinA sporulation pathway (predicted exonuclease)